MMYFDHNYHSSKKDVWIPHKFPVFVTVILARRYHVVQTVQNETVNFTSAEEICKRQGYGEIADVTSASVAKSFLIKCIMENNINDTEQIWIRQVQGKVLL